MAYQPLPILEKDVGELRLDLDNYRIPVRPDDEATALKFLVASEDVLTLVRQLLRDGYFDNEVPIVVEETVAPPPSSTAEKPAPLTRLVVLEGNRRVSALKLIQDPTLVPEHEAEMRALLTRYAREVQDMPSAIRVIVAPSREAASPHVGRLHTGQSKRRWTPDQQAKFYHSLLGPGVGLEEIKAMYPDARVQRLLRMAEMRLFLTGVKFKDPSLKEYVRSDELSMSAFEYAFRPPDIAEAMGVVFDGYQVVPTSKSAATIASGLSETQRNAVEILMNGFRAGVFNTRSAAFKKGSIEKQALLAALRGAPAGPSGPQAGQGDGSDGTESPGGDDSEAGNGDEGSGGFGSGTGDGSQGGDASSGKPGGGGATGGRGRGPNDPDTSRGLPIGGFDLQSAPSNLKHRYTELRKIDVSKTPAAAAMLLRSVIEATAKRHFANTSDHVDGELGNCLITVERVYGRDRAHRNVIRKVRSTRSADVGSLGWFNAAAHDANFPIVEQDVREAFRLAESLLQLLLTSYET